MKGKDAVAFPNRLICFIKLQMTTAQGIKALTTKGTGILLTHNLLLTAAHNYVADTQNRTATTYVKQALSNGEIEKKYKVTKWHISSKYKM